MLGGVRLGWAVAVRMGDQQVDGAVVRGGGAGGEGGGWIHFVGRWCDLGKVVAWIVGAPLRGENQEDAEWRTLQAILARQALTADPAKIPWEAQCIMRSLTLSRDEIRQQLEAMVADMGWRPLEGHHEEGEDYRYDDGLLVPMMPLSALVPISWRGWPSSASE